MAKKVGTNEHHSTTRERVANPHGKQTARQKRRASARETRKAMAANVQHDPRAVKFHF